MPPGTAPRGPASPAASAPERALLSQALALALPDVPAEVPGGSASALLPVLHHLQDALGFVPPALVPDIAAALSLSRAEVHGVITYYHHFRSAPAGRHVVQICQAEACRANGAGRTNITSGTCRTSRAAGTGRSRGVVADEIHDHINRSHCVEDRDVVAVVESHGGAIGHGRAGDPVDR